MLADTLGLIGATVQFAIVIVAGVCCNAYRSCAVADRCIGVLGACFLLGGR